MPVITFPAPVMPASDATEAEWTRYYNKVKDYNCSLVAAAQEKASLAQAAFMTGSDAPPAKPTKANLVFRMMEAENVQGMTPTDEVKYCISRVEAFMKAFPGFATE